MQVSTDLIFDIGMSEGNDTEFYLRKGFRVVGVEADTTIQGYLADRFSAAISAGRLAIEHRAAGEITGDVVTFHNNPAYQGHSSYVTTHGRDLGELNSFDVETINWPTLVEKHGLPYYAKLDIEGAEPPFLRSMLETVDRPPFISSEIMTLEPVRLLAQLGYDRFRIINQVANVNFANPDPPREGVLVPDPNRQHWSGFFGRELPGSRWYSLAEITAVWDLLQELHTHETVAVGWYDCHACRA